MDEMDKRYEAMALLACETSHGYNEKLEKLGDKRPEGTPRNGALPYLVIVIDELATS